MRPTSPSGRLPLPSRVPFALALRRRPRVRRLLGLALVALVALAVALVVRRAEAAREAWGRTEAVVVASRDLPPGHVLGPGDTEVRQLPAPAVPPGAVASVDDGRIVQAGAYEGEVLVARRLAAPGARGPAALLPQGARAVAVPVEPGTAPPLEVGQHVDVVGVVAVDGGPEPVVVAEGALVVHVAERAVSLAVPPDAVPVVAAALAAGTVTLALSG